MSIVEEKALDHIDVPQLDNHNTKIKFNLCHINRLTSDTHGFSDWHDRLTNRHSPQKLPSFSTQISYISNLFPKFDSQPRTNDLKYEECQFTNNHILKQTRVKTQGWEEGVPTVKKQTSPNSGTFRVKRSHTRATYFRQYSRSIQNDEIRSTPPKRVRTSFEIAPPECIQEPRATVRIKRANNSMNNREGTRLQQQREYQMAKLFKRNVIPDYLMYSRRKEQKQVMRLTRKVTKSVFSHYKKTTPQIFT